MTPSICIAPAQPADAGDLVELIRGLAAYEHLEHLVEVTAERIGAELAAQPRAIMASIAREDGRALGFALYFENFSTFLGRRGIYLEDLFVLPQARGRGIGKALVRHVARLAVARGAGRFEWAVLDWNQPAIDFYRALGAVVLPDWRICRVTGDALQRLGAVGGAVGGSGGEVGGEFCGESASE
ncbi:MAG TPA: GNAT family N-acetyltransferase [Burkholderiaceae bacterium]